MLICIEQAARRRCADAARMGQKQDDGARHEVFFGTASKVLVVLSERFTKTTWLCWSLAEISSVCSSRVSARPAGSPVVRPLAILGMNAIAVYLMSEFLAEALGWLKLDERVTAWFRLLVSPVNASLLWALGYTGLMYVFAWALYRRRWFLRI